MKYVVFIDFGTFFSGISRHILYILILENLFQEYGEVVKNFSTHIHANIHTYITHDHIINHIWIWN